MAVDVSRIPNNNKFDPVREAILQLQSDVQSGVSGVGSINGQDGLITITNGSNITVGTVSTTITIGLTSDISITNATLSGYLRGPATFVIDPAAHGDDTGTVVIAGNLQVDGTTTTINSTTLTVDDKNIVLASGAANASAANGAGITIDGANATMTYASATDRFEFNKSISSGNISSSGLIRGDANTNSDYIGLRLQNVFDDDLATSNPSVSIQLFAASNNGYLRVYGAPADTASKHQIDLGSTAGTSFITLSPSSTEVLRATSTGVSITGDLDVSVDVTAPNFIGDLEGNADTATNADQVDGRHAEQFTLDYVTGNPSGAVTDNKITLGSGSAWTSLVLNADPNSGNANAGVAIAFDGTDHSEYGYRFKANGANYYQVLYDGSDINWKHYESSAYATKMSLSNDGDLTLTGNLDLSGSVDVGGSTVISSTRSLDVISATVKGSLNLTTPGAELQVGGVEVIDASRNITAASLATDSITGGTININASTRLNLQYAGSTKAYVDSDGFTIVDAELDLSSVAGIVLTDSSSSTDSYFHANIDYDGGLYTVDSNARYGADYIQVDGLDSREDRRFVISPKDIGSPDEDATLYLGGDYSITAPNTLMDWHTIEMKALSVQINNAEVATQTWVTSNTLNQTAGDNRYLQLTGGTLTNNLTLSYSYPRINLNDTDSEDDWSIINANGTLEFYNQDDNVRALQIDSDNNSTFNGDLKTTGNLFIGTVGQQNWIAFSGTTGDGGSSATYTTTYIGERIYGGTEQSELIIYKGNDGHSSTASPDRIRMIGANLCFDTYNIAQSYPTDLDGVAALTTTRAMTIDTNQHVSITNGNLAVETGVIKIGTTTVIDASRNLTNMGAGSFGGNVTFGGYIDVGSTLYSRSNLEVLNAAGNGWNRWATRSNGQYNLDIGSLDVDGTATFNSVAVFKGQVSNYDGSTGRTSYWSYDDKVAAVFEPAADDGAVAILFPSIGNSPSDFAYIAYDEDFGEAGVTAGENGVLLLSSQNDGGGSSDHVRVLGRLVVQAETSSSNPTHAFQVKDSNVTTDLFRVARSGASVFSSTLNVADQLTVDDAIRLTSNPSITGDSTGVYFWNQAGVGATIASNAFEVRTGGNTTAFSIDNAQNATFADDLTVTDYLYVGASTGISSSGWIHLHRYSSNLNVAVGNNGTNINLIVPNGSVGIGTNSPAYKLDVNGTTRSSKFVSLVNTNRSSVGVRDWLLVGTYDRAGAIEVGDISGARYAIWGGGYDLKFGKHISTTDTYVNVMQFLASNATDTSVDVAFTSGNVGIGTTSPAYKLDVNGTANVSGIFKVTAGASDPTKTTDSSQFVIDSSNQQLAIGVTGTGNGRYAWILSRHDGLPTYGGYYCTLHLQPRVGSEEDYEGVAIGYGVTTKLPSDVSLACNDKVGIGTTTPDSKLQIANADGSWYRFGYGGTSDVYIDARTTYFRTANGGSNTVTIDSVGKVGIGTTSPTSKLQVSGDAYVTGEFSQGVANANKIYSYGSEFRSSGASIQIAFGRDGNNIGSGAIGADASNCFVAWSPTGTVQRLVVTQGGNVGIGTTSPSQKLQVKGNIQMGVDPTLYWESNTLKLQTSYNAIGVVQLRGSTSYAPRFEVYNANNVTKTTQIHGDGTTYFNGGNVGIGTTSPNFKLDVEHNGNATNGIQVTNTSTGTSARAVVEFVSDSAQLDIYATGSNYSGVTGWNDAGVISTSTSSSNGLILNAQSNGITFQGGTATRMFISKGGNVGIGTTDPKAKLNVVGSVLLAREHGITQLNNNKDWANMTSGIVWREYNHALSSHPTTSDAMTEMIKGGTFTDQGVVSNVDSFTRSDETYAVEFLGYYYATSNDTYSFSISSDDAGDIYIDGTRVADWYNGHGDNNSPTGGTGQNAGSIYLVKGFHKIYARYEEIGGGDSASLWHKIGSGSWEKIPANRLYHKAEDLFRATGSGNVTLTGTFTATADIVAYSDERIKENVETIDNALDKVQQLRGVSFNRIKDGSKSIGVIAQEIEKVLPEVVTEDDKGIKGVAYGNVVGVLIEAIKEQQKQIDELKARLDGSTK